MNTSSRDKSRIRYILFFDGTWNDFDSETNIQHLYQSTLKGGRQGVRQMPVYWEAVWGRTLGEVSGGHVWLFLLEDGVWLKVHGDCMSHRSGDEVYLFGFSRGAFTAMGLAGLLAWRGLPREYVPDQMLDEHIDLYRRATQNSREKVPGRRPLAQLSALSSDEKEKALRLDRDALEKFRSVPIKFVGLFDTVRAARTQSLKWLGTRLPHEVPPGRAQVPARNARLALHAPSASERRAGVPKRWQWTRTARRSIHVCGSFLNKGANARRATS